MSWVKNLQNAIMKPQGLCDTFHTWKNIFAALTFILLTIKACTNEIIYKSIIVEEQ